MSSAGMRGGLATDAYVQVNNLDVIKIETNLKSTLLGAADVTGALVAKSTLQADGLMLPKAGIQFPATQVASSDPNTLDDYEEGTWAPSNASVSMTVVTANYIKIGRLVVINGQVNFVSNSNASNLQLTNLPFPVASIGPLSVGYHNTALSNLSIMAVSGAGNGTINVYTGGSFATFQQFSGAQLYFGGSYITTA